MARSKTHRVTLPESLDAWMHTRMTAEGFESADEYLRHLLRREASMLEHAAIEARLLESINSPSRPLTEADWRRLKTRIHRKSKQTPKRRATGG